MSGFEWVPYAASAAASAGGAIYSSNQANSTAAGNAYTANMVNMASQVQNQGYNSAEAAIGRDFNADQAERGRDFTSDLFRRQEMFNEKESNLNRSWQESMSNTSYQRAVADMKKAGLNPMLAYSQGGAHTGSGSAASVAGGGSPTASSGAASSGSAPRAEVPNVQRVPIESIGNSALDMLSKKAAIDNVEADTAKKREETTSIPKTRDEIIQRTELLREQIKTQFQQTLTEADRRRLIQAQQLLTEATTDFTGKQSATESNRADLVKAQTAIAGVEKVLKDLETGPAKAESDFAAQAGTMPRWVQMLGRALGAIGNSASAVRR